MSDEGMESGGSPEQALQEHTASVREDAIRAVKEAVAAEASPEDDNAVPPAKASSDDASDASVERGKDGKFLPKNAKEKAGTPTKAEASNPEEEAVTNSKVAKLLREREQRNEERQQIRQEREAFLREQAAFAAEREQVKKDREWLERLRKDPKLAVREAHKQYGDQWSPEEFIMSLAKDGTDEGRLQREHMSTREELAEIKRQIADYTERETKYREQLNSQHQNQVAVQTENRFVAVAMNEEKYPHLVDQYEGMEHVLVDMAHKVGQEYHRRTGEWANDEDIAEYLDGLRKERIAKRTSQTSASKSGNATPARAQGSRTITTAGASEKRVVTQSPDREMTDDERREAAKAAVRAALREHAG